jgi:hypothetical protein
LLIAGKVLYSQTTLNSIDRSLLGDLQEEGKGKGADIDSDTQIEEQDSPKPADGPTEITGVERAIEADLSRQTGDSDCYMIYIKSMGVTVAVTFFCLCTLLVL